ncbi:hypothetical protein Pst134EA_032455 [Puccinia striiformis f. sp. tritici]|nr:uncharacterized protein Pst134EA_032455 [Puccinia striiformis f. sp. tritici]KAH9444226.1 hypothetical protein Pst134EA_032455 [Puccinia striiformis f. sp. tritici]
MTSPKNRRAILIPPPRDHYPFINKDYSPDASDEDAAKSAPNFKEDKPKPQPPKGIPKPPPVNHKPPPPPPARKPKDPKHSARSLHHPRLTTSRRVLRTVNRGLRHPLSSSQTQETQERRPEAPRHTRQPSSPRTSRTVVRRKNSLLSRLTRRGQRRPKVLETRRQHTQVRPLGRFRQLNKMSILSSFRLNHYRPAQLSLYSSSAGLYSRTDSLYGSYVLNLVSLNIQDDRNRMP